MEASESKPELWSYFNAWAEQKKNGIALTNSDSYLTFSNRDKSKSFNIQSLMAFNPQMQIDERFFWANKDFYSTQDDAIKKLGESNNRDILDTIYDKKVYLLRSMPPFEFYNNRFTLSKSVVEDTLKVSEKLKLKIEEREIEYSNEQVLLDLYTHRDYYSTLQNRTFNIFFSQAFEVVLFSFIAENEVKWDKNLQSILARIPFYSLFNINKTKLISVNNDSSDDDDDEEEIDYYKYSSSSSYLAGKIQAWRIEHADFFSVIAPENLISIFSVMFNKVFTQLSLIKSLVKDSNYNGEHLTDMARRFELVMINSALTTVIDEGAVNANAALTDKHETLRNYKKFEKFDRTVTRNEAILAETKNSELEKSFINAMKQHPIFTLHHADEVLTDKFKLYQVSSSSRKKTSKIDEITKELESFIDKYNLKVTSRAEVIKWIGDTSEENKKLTKDLYLKLKTLGCDEFNISGGSKSAKLFNALKEIYK
ncbi:hypothetical protein [Photobacterium sanguinicancri]|uniref:hypothetical protein n=1 Tax=Photobacterium sanguinicancri TaxID=875932 RepID=UPI000791AD5D|nr:hypothetical protein [Photobacterium sanguinicancri]KXI21036.1 hypothetical protein AS132_23115 [Photobacterium sanguinicancri]